MIQLLCWLDLGKMLSMKACEFKLYDLMHQQLNLHPAEELHINTGPRNIFFRSYRCLEGQCQLGL